MSKVDYRSKCIREKGEVCFRCVGLQGNNSGVVVHHIDEDRENNQLDNLAPLCQSCHIIWHKNDLWGGDFQEFLQSWPDSRVTADRPAQPMTGEGRALLTDRERDVLTGEADANINYEYKVKSLVRNRLRKRLGQDIEILEEHFEEGFELVEEEVCDRDNP